MWHTTLTDQQHWVLRQAIELAIHHWVQAQPGYMADLVATGALTDQDKVAIAQYQAQIDTARAMYMELVQDQDK